MPLPNSVAVTWLLSRRIEIAQVVLNILPRLAGKSRQVGFLSILNVAAEGAIAFRAITIVPHEEWQLSSRNFAQCGSIQYLRPLFILGENKNRDLVAFLFLI
jgi:hypothetical protein